MGFVTYINVKYMTIVVQKSGRKKEKYVIVRFLQ